MGVWTVELTGRLPESDVAQLGGKARGLYALQHMGVNIPPTLCVKISCFEDVIRDALGKSSNINVLRDCIRKAKLAEPLVQELSEWLQRHDNVFWCVRSSGKDEDGHDFSFAGQHLSLHQITGLEGLCQAIRDVWVSAFEDHVLLYRDKSGASLIPSGMGVVIQPMLTPSRAGVMFSRDPEQLSHDKIRVISSAEGLGTAVVDGSQDATTYFIEAKSRYTRSKKGGEDGELQEHWLTQLLDLADHVEANSPSLEGWGHDIEWAFVQGGVNAVEGTLYVLQLRPLKLVHEGVDAVEGRAEVYTNANVGEALPGVGTPLTWSVIHRFSKKGFEQAFKSLGLVVPEDVELVRGFHGRVYLNLTQFMEIASAVPLLRPEVLFELAGGGGVDEVKGTYQGGGNRVKFMVKLPWTALKIASSQLGSPALSMLWERYFARQRDDFFLNDYSRLSARELKATFQKTEQLFDRNGLVMLSASSNFLLLYIVMREVIRFWSGDDELTSLEQNLMGGLEVKSAEPGLELLRLGRLVRRSLYLRETIAEHASGALYEHLKHERDRADVAQFMVELEKFRALYGHRAPREAELSTPRWREDTTFIFDVLKSFVNAPSLVTQRELEREKQARRDEKDAVIRGMFSGAMRPVFRKFLTLVRRSAQRRESLRALVVDALDMYRVLVLECGARLVRQGALASKEDVFFLQMEELWEWLEKPDDASFAERFRMLTLVRKVIYEHQRDLPDPPGSFLSQNGRIIALDRVPEQDVERSASSEFKRWTLYGLAGSKGHVSGVARLLTDPSQRAKLGHGDILVVPYADVGWTPLFLSAGGVVMSLGGPLSHACVVAREYGIPVVANVSQALDVIEDGDWLTVDGETGIITVERMTV